MPTENKKHPSESIDSARPPNSQKPWEGRFSEATAALAEDFTESVSFDRRLWEHDIQVSLAHAQMLAKIGVLCPEEAELIRTGLDAVAERIRAGKFVWRRDLEDVHMNIEAALVECIGDVGKKLHTARSRNDQVATDMRLWLRSETRSLCASLCALMTTLVNLAERHKETVMPGFTHMQIAQPVILGHHLLAWCEMFLRDHERLGECARRMDVMPLGSAALAGTSFPIDRQSVADALGFAALSRNSLDAVSDRDFLIEWVHCASLIMMHLSRIAEELILWMSAPFGFIELGDAWCTGSSIMPQKKNPDIPELVRGKTGRVYGSLMSLLTLMKSQPLAYNRDNQEDKEPVFDAADTVSACVQAMNGALASMMVDKARMHELASAGFSTATDLADYLTARKLPFRDAHKTVGKIVQHAIGQGKKLQDFSLAELREFSGLFDESALDVLTLQGSVSARNHFGGTAPEQVGYMVEWMKKELSGKFRA
ncbi:MAG: argininosuccinate lyase [Candidatus Eutrophobiaceae bacterium]